MRYLILLFMLNFLYGFEKIAPKALYLDTINNKVFATFAASFDLKHKFVKDKLYPLAYNSRYFAYIIEHNNSPADIFSANFIIQNLVNDKIIYINKFRIDNPDYKYNFNKYLKAKNTLISSKLKEFNINKKSIAYKKDRLYFKGDSYRLYAKSNKKYCSNFDSNFLVSSKIYISSAKKGTKIIDKKYYKHPSHILARKPIGFLKFGNNKRVAVIVAKVIRGWEGPPNNIKYEIVGANLKVGFKD